MESTAEPPTHITLKVLDQSGEEVHFKMRRHTPMRKLMDAFCQRRGLSLATLRFLYNGERLKPEDTSMDHAMEDNDTIDVMLMQTGGGAARA